MAKDISKEEEDDKFEKMDEESMSFLEQVRKGKSRNFVLSMKGNKVRSMVVKKKPIKEKDRKAARGEGFQPVFGVASGMGAKITFSIARTDGFEEKDAGRKTEKLKKFLSSQTGKVFKPAIELVDVPPPIPFDEEDLSDPLIARFMALEPKINQACGDHPDSVSLIQASVQMIRGLLQEEETRQSAGPKIGELEQYLTDLMAGNAAVPPAPPPPPDSPAAAPPPTDQPVAADPAAEFKARLTALLPKIKAAVGTPTGDDAKLKASEAGVFARKQDFGQANDLLDEVESLLQAGSSAAAATPAVEPAARAAKLAEALKKLKPLVDKVINADANRKGELHATMAQIAGEIKSQQFELAKNNITNFVTLLKSLAAQAQAQPTTADRMPQFEARRDALEPRLLDAQRADRDKATKLGAVWDYAQDQASTGNFDNAFKAFDRLEAAIDQTLAAAPATDAQRYGIPENIVQQRKTFLASRWQQVIIGVRDEIEKLRPAVTELLSAQAADQLVAGIQDGLAGFYSELSDVITNTDQATAANTSSLEAALEMVRTYLAKIESDERIKLLADAKSELGVDVNVKDLLQGALHELESRLAG